ncbi:unnamed protein product, partial [marine sediment metagenome]
KLEKINKKKWSEKIMIENSNCMSCSKYNIAEFKRNILRNKPICEFYVQKILNDNFCVHFDGLSKFNRIPYYKRETINPQTSLSQNYDFNVFSRRYLKLQEEVNQLKRTIQPKREKKQKNTRNKNFDIVINHIMTIFLIVPMILFCAWYISDLRFNTSVGIIIATTFIFSMIIYLIWAKIS